MGTVWYKAERRHWKVMEEILMEFDDQSDHHIALIRIATKSLHAHFEIRVASSNSSTTVDHGLKLAN